MYVLFILTFSSLSRLTVILALGELCFSVATGTLILIRTYSVQRGGRVEIIANDQGHRITPSWVSFTDDERLWVHIIYAYQ